MSTNNTEICFKVFVLGDSRVGKTCFIQRLCSNVFKDNISTIGCDMLRKELELNDGSQVNIDVWDTAGQERFRSITKSMIKNADGIIVMYDITDKQSFDNVTQWVTDIKSIISSTVVTLLVGNKCDLGEQREVLTDEGKKKGEELNITFIETSSKKNINIEQSMMTLAENINANKKIKRSNDNITILFRNNAKNKNNKQKHCC